jgi:hypothetical protein
MKRNPDLSERNACFRVLFYAVGDGLTLGEHSTGDRPVEGDAHDQDQSFETIGFLDMALHEAESAAFEVGEHVLDPPCAARRSTITASRINGVSLNHSRFRDQEKMRGGKVTRFISATPPTSAPIITPAARMGRKAKQCQLQNDPEKIRSLLSETIAQIRSVNIPLHME